MRYSCAYYTILYYIILYSNSYIFIRKIEIDII
uniref:Uncharacterized protein n=1 Tax=viral metagenome TaxID=1070528 RepID=A0A6C0EWA8_9ZZZZ